MMTRSHSTTAMGNTPCESLALCQDAVRIGWTAIDPCASCVATAITPSYGHANQDGNRDASPAALVTGDALERLLTQECGGIRDSSTS